MASAATPLQIQQREKAGTTPTLVSWRSTALILISLGIVSVILLLLIVNHLVVVVILLVVVVLIITSGGRGSSASRFHAPWLARCRPLLLLGLLLPGALAASRCGVCNQVSPCSQVRELAAFPHRQEAQTEGGQLVSKVLEKAALLGRERVTLGAHSMLARDNDRALHKGHVDAELAQLVAHGVWDVERPRGDGHLRRRDIASPRKIGGRVLGKELFDLGQWSAREEEADVPTQVSSKHRELGAVFVCLGRSERNLHDTVLSQKEPAVGEEPTDVLELGRPHVFERENKNAIMLIDALADFLKEATLQVFAVGLDLGERDCSAGKEDEVNGKIAIIAIQNSSASVPILFRLLLGIFK